MKDTQKKQSFLHGAALLAIATAIVKVLGAFYKIPLKMIIGDQGYGYFVTAYDIYSVLLLASTAGLPIAMSRMISQADALGRTNQIRRVYKTAQGIFLGLGVVSSFFMTFFCRQLAEFQHQPDAWVAIGCLGPCALLMCIMSAFRGFFQGQGNMRPTSNSQILEAAVKLVVGLAAAYAVMFYTKNKSFAAGAAILGVTASCVFSVTYLFAKFLPTYRQLPASDDIPRSYGYTTRGLLAMAIPITLGSAGLQFLTVLETNIYMGQLLGPVGLTQMQADTTKGVYNMAQTIFNMPCAFMVPISTSVLPAITAQLTLDNDRGVKSTEESAARVTGLFSLPCAVGLIVLAKPIMALLGDYRGANLELATKLLALLGVNVFYNSIIQYTNAVLQSHNKAHIPVINMLLFGVLRLGVVHILAGNPNIGIMSAPLGMGFCYLSIAIMNLIAIRHLVHQKPAIIRNFLRAMPPALIMGAMVFAAHALLTRVLGADGSRLILCVVPVMVGGAAYLVSIALCKSITREDCALLPKGDKIARILRL